MALILNLETSTTVCSVCVAKNGRMLALREENNGYRHAEKIHVFVQEVLNEAGISLQQLQAVAVSKGPGSYTGLRIGVSAAKGYCFALGIPLIGIQTLQSMAAGILTKQQNIQEDTVLCPMMDARRMEVYTACFDTSLNTVLETSAEVIESQPFYDKPDHQVLFFGDGAEKCVEMWKGRSNFTYVPNGLPSAQFIAQLAEKSYEKKEFEDVAYFEPFYYKDFMATKPKNPIQRK